MRTSTNGHSRFYTHGRERPYLSSSRLSLNSLPNFIDTDSSHIKNRRFAVRKPRKSWLTLLHNFLHRLSLSTTPGSKVWLKKVGVLCLIVIPAFLLLVLDGPGEGVDEIGGRQSRRWSRGIDFLDKAIDGTKVQPGISLVAGCRDSPKALVYSLKEWEKVQGVDEILVVDWGSSIPLKEVVDRAEDKDARVRFVRAEEENKWVASRAYNLGVKAATRDKVILLGCHEAMGRNFLDQHQLSATEDDRKRYYADTREKVDGRVGGYSSTIMCIRRADYLQVGGRDERLHTAAFDIENLQMRLSKVGVQRDDLQFSHVLSDAPSDDIDVVRNQEVLTPLQRNYQQLILSQIPSWTSRKRRDTRWSIVKSSKGGDLVVRAQNVPKTIQDSVSPRDAPVVWDNALAHQLHEEFDLPSDLLSGMVTRHKEALYGRLSKKKPLSGNNNPNAGRVFFAHCMHGLGNRLRALGSAMAFAKSTGRELVIIWETDSHNAARFDDLFDSDMIVLHKMHPQWPFLESKRADEAWGSVRAYNYMTMEGNGAKKDKEVVDEHGTHIYYKGAYILNVSNSKLTNWELDNDMLRTLRPVREVAGAVKEQEKNGVAERIGLHIRDRTLGRDIKDVNFKSEYGKDDATQMEFWRQKSSHTTFIAEMRRIIEKDNSAKFYVSTDTVAVLKRLQKEFPGRIAYTKRNCDGRDGKCVRYALIDILCLAKTKEIYGSNWSSFTEAAERFGRKAAKLAGVHFAVEKKLSPR